MSGYKTWLERMDEPVLELRPHAANRHAERKDAPMIEALKKERELLEVRYATERSLLDRLIYRLAPAQELASIVESEPSGSTPPVVVPASQKPSGVFMGATKPLPLPARSTEPSATKPRRTNGRSGSNHIRQYIMAHPEFTQGELIKELRITRSAASCCVLKMLSRGEVERVGRGSYRRLASFKPTAPDSGSVAKSYSESRASLGDLRLPEVS